MPKIWSGSSGGGSSGGAGGAATPSIVIAQAARPSSVALSTEGTLDWFTITAASMYSNQYAMRVPEGLHRKSIGEGDIGDSFHWFAGTGAGPTYYNSISTGATLTTVASDSAFGGAALNEAHEAAVHTGGGINYGFKFRVAAAATARVLRLYMGTYSATAQIRAALPDGTVATADYTGTATTNVNKKVTITYNASTPGQVLLVSVKITANLGGSGNLRFGAVTLATS